MQHDVVSQLLAVGGNSLNLVLEESNQQREEGVGFLGRTIAGLLVGLFTSNNGNGKGAKWTDAEFASSFCLE